MATATTTQGRIRVHRQGPVVIFQVIGLGRMQQSMPMRRFCEKALTEGTTALRFDLRHCSYVDSTFLGTLLLLRRKVQRVPGCEFALVSPSSECSRLFKQMGVEECFPTIDTGELPESAWVDLTIENNVEAFNRNVVQAHEELANLGGSAGKAFEGVSRCLRGNVTDDLP